MDKLNIFKLEKRLKMVASGPLFFISLLVIVITLLAVWLLDLGRHRTLFANALWDISILSVVFLSFIVYGLYHGFKLKDNLGRITDRMKFYGLSALSSKNRKRTGTRTEGNSWSFGELSADIIGEGCANELGTVLLWILAAIVAVILLWLLGNVLWGLLVIFAAMLYWIFFRALRLVFRKSVECKGRFFKSLAFGLFYAVLYSCWIYAIVMSAHYFIH